MNRLTLRLVTLAILAMGGAVAGYSFAHAQSFNKIKGGAAQAEQPTPAPPPALPGAKSSAAAPANRIPTDMAPTEALFDSINRGDIAAARDAISRGADLSGRNLLGMTPMELSVDLGRNDISFLLLSMRGAENPRDRQPPAVEPVRRATRQATKPAPAQARAVPATPQTARLFAGDGGTPNPNAGFLGFDTNRR